MDSANMAAVSSAARTTLRETQTYEMDQMWLTKLFLLNTQS